MELLVAIAPADYENQKEPKWAAAEVCGGKLCSDLLLCRVKAKEKRDLSITSQISQSKAHFQSQAPFWEVGWLPFAFAKAH